MRTSLAAVALAFTAVVSSAQPAPAPTAAPRAPSPASPARPAPPSRAAAPSGVPPVTVLKAARLFDGRSDRVIENGVVIIEDSRIRDVGSNLPIPPDATALDLGDATILAGFIDSHTHVTDEATDNWLADFYEGLRRPVPEKAIIATAYARKVLEAGFTTVRDLGSSDSIDVGLRNAINRGRADSGIHREAEISWRRISRSCASSAGASLRPSSRWSRPN